MSLVTRRRAIYTGLSRYLPETELLPIMSFWEANYAEKPAFALNEFLAEVAKRCSQKLERASLYRPDAQARQTFEALSARLFAALPESQLFAFRRLVASNLAKVSGETELRLRLRAWLEQGGGLARISLDIQQLRTLLSLIYGGLCEHFGPVQADQLLSQAVREVERMNLPLPPQKLL